ncbi:urease accessory protein UreE [Hyphomicrobium facile]|uniref:Urease accessory protein UreE n=1 Tax=Hyphomicrobium facile TaxID=51670 RepID=A0A1I7NIF9_9HYPH|nr:urease accessory protein UreE [Hyphomicrobium facile]SFV34356.1 urease accessory protein [Hyphomicrobium facile]
MIIIEGIVGNSGEPDWASRLEGARVDWLVLDQWEAQKSRLRKSTENDVELALSLDRNTHLHDGDILLWNERDHEAIIARINLKEVMVIDLTAIMEQPTETALRTMFELGHALGNQHWPAVVKSSRVFVPLTVDRKVMASVMKTHALPGIRYEFMPGAEVIPYMAPHEARRLFGGATEASHSHGPDSHSHEHEVNHHDGHDDTHEQPHVHGH